MFSYNMTCGLDIKSMKRIEDALPIFLGVQLTLLADSVQLVTSPPFV